MIKLRFTLFTLIIALFAACSDKENTPNDKQNSAKQAFLKSIKTTPAVLTNYSGELILAGSVEYDPEKVVSYVPLMSGVIEKLYFSLGEKVSKGQALLDIKSSELSSLQTEYVNAELEVKIAERELQTAQSMYDDDILSEKELLEAQAKVKQANAALDKANSDISTMGINKGGGVFTIKSPVSGYIVEKNGASGSPVTPDSSPLFVVADLNSVWIIVNVYASNLQTVKEGMDVEIETLSYPGEVFHGKISSLSQVFDSEEKILKARIVMPNKDLKFKPGMSVVVKLKSNSDQKMIAIPSSAVIFDKNSYHVVVEDTQGHFQSKDIKLQGHHKDMSFVSSGLTEGENVVIKNQLLIYSGLKEE